MKQMMNHHRVQPSIYLSNAHLVIAKNEMAQSTTRRACAEAKDRHKPFMLHGDMHRLQEAYMRRMNELPRSKPLARDVIQNFEGVSA